MHETCLIIIHEPGMRPSPGIEPGTFVLVDGCSTTELTILLIGMLVIVFSAVYGQNFKNNSKIRMYMITND